MTNKLKEIFVYVNDSDVQSFITNHTSKDEELLDAYTEKIAFLGSSGKIVTHGNIYNEEEIYIGKSSNAPSSAKIIIDDESNQVEVYSKGKVDKLMASKKYIIFQEDDSFNFSDSAGNVVAKIDANGVHSVGFFDSDGNEITYRSSTSGTAINRFTNKNVFSLCDSLGSGGGWQTTFCNEVGARAFNQELNGGAELKAQGLTLSCGGAATLHRVTFGWDGRPDGLTSGQQRAVNFVKQSVATYGTKDYLFLENINDFNFFGDECTDEMIEDPSNVDPVMVEETYTYTGEIFATATAARDYFNNNLSTVLSGITPSVNRAVTLKYGSKKFSFNIANAATQDGTVTITINGQEYVEQVLEGTSIANIAQQLYEINFVGYDNSRADDVLSITANTVASADYTVTVTTTCGCGITVTQASTTGNWSAVFTSHDVNDWLDSTKWEINVTSMRAIMGLIEYLEQKLPKTHLIYVLMPRYPFKWNAYLKADGTPDEHAFRKLDIVKKFERFLKMQKAVCEYYNLEYIDLAHTMGWNYNNMKTWYGEGTIHWNSYAHEYIGKFLANKLA